MKRIVSLLLTLAVSLSLAVPASAASDFQDVPATGTLAGEVQKAVDYGLMSGYSATTFGYGNSMTRIQFLTVLGRMMGWFEGTHTEQSSVTDAMQVGNLSGEYLLAAEMGVRHDVVNTDIAFRPNEPITRGEMSELLVRAMGLKSTAAMVQRLWSDQKTAFLMPSQFADVSGSSAPYITVAQQIGMTNGTSATTFSPNNTATRAQAAAMLVRIYEKLRQKTDFVHGFYAISSHSQLGLTDEMDAVSAGWSRMTWDGATALLSTTSANDNEYAIPGGYQDVTDYLSSNGTPLHLSVFMSGSELKELLSSETGRQQAVEQIVNELTVSYKAIGRNPYSGVTIDFEGLRYAQKADFKAFLNALSSEVHSLNKQLYVCVSPVVSSFSDYYDGYDYETIGALSDKVILMAYDYEARDLTQFVGTEYYKTSATEPISEVYLGLWTLTQKVNPDKVLLGYSAKNVAFQIDTADKLIAGTPVYVSNDVLAKRLGQSDTVTGWSNTYQQPYGIYTTEDGSRYFVWYDNAESTQLRLNTAKLLGVTGVSLWRLGTIPAYDSWNWNGILSR